MLTWLRDNAKIFLIATIVIFVALIFLRWGMGEGDNTPKNPYQRPLATVDGKDILPDEYQQALQSWNQRYRTMLEQSGNPDPESMMILMSSQISEDAFQGLIDQKLQGIYLKHHNWTDFTVEQAEELLIAQIGMQDLGEMTAREYLDMIKSDQPGLYQQYLYQTYMNASNLRFPLASGMVSMASLAEVDYLTLDARAQIAARYIVIRPDISLPDEEYLREFYDTRPEYFIRPAGSLLRHITVQIHPVDSDLEFTLNRIDSLVYASAGQQTIATRSQIAGVFGDSIRLETGVRTEPFLSMYSGNPSISSYHVLLLDSLHESTATYMIDSTSVQDDTLFLQTWEVPLLPQYSTVRSVMWDLELSMEDMLAEPIPDVPDSLVMVDFGEMLVEDNTPLSGIVSQELVAFATDTLWSDPLGPVFFSPSYLGGYPAFTMVRRLEYFPVDTTSYEEALETGLLFQTAMYSLGRETAIVKAQEIVDDLRSSGISLSAYASAESLQVNSIPSFTAAQIRLNARMDSEAAGGILYSQEFAEAALTASEFQIIGPFVTGGSCIIAEILSRQVSTEDQNMQTLTYISAQYGHEMTGSEYIIRNLRETSNIHDLREEWSDYLEVVEDSLASEQEQLDE